jgi:predicted cytidylate kinase
MRITISGPPGSGKTTVCRMLADELHMECVISGEVFRQMARDHGMSLAEFGLLAEQDPSYDRMLDDRMVDLARESDDIILEGRLTAHMLSRNGLRAFRVLLDADLDERARRVVEREGISPDEARNRIVERERCEAARYLEYYDIDIDDHSIFDLVVDTTSISAPEVTDVILRRLRE